MKSRFWIFCSLFFFFVIGGGLVGCRDDTSNFKPISDKEEIKLTCGQKFLSVVSVSENIIENSEGKFSYGVSFITRPMRPDEFPEVYTFLNYYGDKKIIIIECK